MTTAYPLITDATAFWDGTTWTITYVLLQNTGGYGYISTSVYADGGSLEQIKACYNPRITLKIMNALYWPGGPFAFITKVEANRCASDIDQNCAVSPPTCASIIVTDTYLNIPVRAKDSIVPSTPTGLTIVPGDKKLTVSWNSVTNTPIFTYRVTINQGVTVIDSGYVEESLRNIVIDNLTNGLLYTIKIEAMNHSGIFGSAATGTGTPVCPSVICGFTIPT